VICEAGDVVVVPFPFTDSVETKRRPALILSPAEFNRQSGHSVMAMITSANRSSWPGDVAIGSSNAGLRMPCVVRMKLFTLDNRLIAKTIGRLPEQEWAQVRGFLDGLLR
jgi:mRNA interferase MazF